jgi:DNA polymerase elongation subunit (family B)
MSILDYWDLYDEFTFEQLESYTLNNVCLHEKVGGKIDLGGHINDAWKRDWNNFVDYNVQDVLLVEKLENKKKFIQLTIKMASDCMIPLEKVMSSVAVIEGLILKELHVNDMVMPDRQKAPKDMWHELQLYRCEDGWPRGIQNDPDVDLESHVVKRKSNVEPFPALYVKGGHVESTPGYYRKVMSFDATSLYPHEIICYNISPETKVFNPTNTEGLIKSRVNGIYYKREEGIFPKIIKKVFNERKMYKQKMFECEKLMDFEGAEYYDSMQLIRKILLNSIYGVLLSEYFHFYDVDNARAVTRGGRCHIRYVKSCINDYFKHEWHKTAKTWLGSDCVTGDLKPIEKDKV